MSETKEKVILKLDAKETVKLFLTCLNEGNYAAARQYLAEHLKFEGVLGQRDGAEVYLKDMEKMQFRYSVQKIISDENEVAVLYNIDMGGITILTSGWYHLENGKITHIRVIFDPRPVLEKGK